MGTATQITQQSEPGPAFESATKLSVEPASGRELETLCGILSGHDCRHKKCPASEMAPVTSLRAYPG